MVRRRRPRRFENNESLGLELRSQIGFRSARASSTATGRSWRSAPGWPSTMSAASTSKPPRTSRRSSCSRRRSTPTIGRRRTLDITLQYYPSLSDAGRQRMQFDAGVKRELWKDFFVVAERLQHLRQPPAQPEANTNDVGVVLSIGWSY